MIRNAVISISILFSYALKALTKYLPILAILFTSCHTIIDSPLLDKIEDGDSVIIYAQFAECGEWGGHVEEIKLIKKGNMFLSSFYEDTILCPHPTRLIKIRKTKNINFKDKYYIQRYIDNFFSFKNIDIEVWSNASCYYSIISPDTTYELYIDSDIKWNEFKKKRTLIFD